MKKTVIFLCVMLLVACQGERVTVSGLRCEWLTYPLGLDTPSPHLSWEIAGGYAVYEVGSGAYSFTANTKN